MPSLFKSILKITFAFFLSLQIHFVANAQTVNAPNFWDPAVRFSKPDLSNAPRLKFLTTTDFPPFNFIDRKKRLSGFNIELARAICVELDLLRRCQIQALPWAELQDALSAGDGEAIIAGLQVNTQTRKNFSFSEPYLKIPGRFISRRDAGLTEPIYKSLFRKTVGVVASSSHQEYFSQAFAQRSLLALPTRQAAFNALKEGSVDAVFTDALSASFWLPSKDAADCCQFAGGAFLSDKYFGSGLSIATKKEDRDLLSAINFALKKIHEDGKFLQLYLKYFPLGLF